MFPPCGTGLWEAERRRLRRPSHPLAAATCDVVGWSLHDVSSAIAALFSTITCEVPGFSCAHLM